MIGKGYLVIESFTLQFHTPQKTNICALKAEFDISHLIRRKRNVSLSSDRFHSFTLCFVLLSIILIIRLYLNLDQLSREVIERSSFQRFPINVLRIVHSYSVRLKLSCKHDRYLLMKSDDWFGCESYFDALSFWNEFEEIASNRTVNQTS